MPNDSNNNNGNTQPTPPQAPSPKPAQPPQSPSRRTIFNEGDGLRAIKTGGSLPPDND